MKNSAFLFLLLSFLCSGCVYLTFDNTKASPLVMISRTPTPASEEVRSFVQYGDLVYVAAGSGGLLVYRTVGDQMQPVPSLSLRNIYADNLDPVFVRTIEIVEGRGSTNLIFAFDTVAGGGIGAAEITGAYTKPLGALTAVDGMRIRRTDSRADPEGGFLITAANEYEGVITYRLSVVSNNFFDRQNLASIAGYVAVQGLGGAFRPFDLLQPPGQENQGAVTNLEALIALYGVDPKRASSIAAGLPFLSSNQRTQIEGAAQKALGNPGLLSAASNFISSGNTGQLIDAAQAFLNAPAGAPPPNPGGDPIDGPGPANDSNGPPINVANDPAIGPGLLSNTAALNGKPTNGAAANVPSETNLDYFLSNLTAMTNYTVDSNSVNTPDFNPFVYSRPIKNAEREIDITASAFGLQSTADDQGILKERLLSLTAGEKNAVFETLFNQADLLARIVPLLEKSGFNPRQLYQFWQEGRINEIIDKMDTALLADLIKLLPQTSIEVKLTAVATNALLPSIRNMSADARSFYLALGKEGFAVIDRASGSVLRTVNLPFSEVEAAVPFNAHGKNYIAIADRLDGLSVYERLRDNSPGERVAKLNLIGEGLSLNAQDDLLWLADGSNGVLAIRFGKDHTLTIEGEFFDKQGVARYIGTARPREALVSYGADGFVRLRFTNIVAEDIKNQSLTNAAADKTFAQRTLEWNETSPFFRFLRRLF